MGYRQAVRHQVLILALVGSNPATPAKYYDPLAQSAEHLTLNQGVRSSNLRWVTNYKAEYARVVELMMERCPSGLRSWS